MKNRLIIASSVALALSGQYVIAGSIATVHTTGETLTAGTMNAINAEVTDNDTRITNNAAAITNKQNTVTGSCAIGSSIRAIAANGTVTCETDADTVYTDANAVAAASAANNTIQRRVTGTCVIGSSIRAISNTGTVTCEIDTDTTYSAGTGLNLSAGTFSVSTKTHYLTVPAAAFRPIDDDTTFAGGTTNPYMNIIGGTLAAVAPLDLPHGAIITSLSMRVWDLSSTNSVTIDLRKFTGFATTTSISTVSTTIAENAGFYNKTSSAISETVDLSTTSHNFYYLLQTLPSAGTTNGPGPYAVRVSYTY